MQFIPVLSISKCTFLKKKFFLELWKIVVTYGKLVAACPFTGSFFAAICALAACTETKFSLAIVCNPMGPTSFSTGQKLCISAWHRINYLGVNQKIALVGVSNPAKLL